MMFVTGLMNCDWMMFVTGLVNCDWMMFVTGLVNCDWMVFVTGLVNCDWMVFVTGLVNCDWMMHSLKSATRVRPLQSALPNPSNLLTRILNERRTCFVHTEDMRNNQALTNSNVFCL